MSSNSRGDVFTKHFVDVQHVKVHTTQLGGPKMRDSRNGKRLNESKLKLGKNDSESKAQKWTSEKQNLHIIIPTARIDQQCHATTANLNTDLCDIGMANSTTASNVGLQDVAQVLCSVTVLQHCNILQKHEAKNKLKITWKISQLSR